MIGDPSSKKMPHFILKPLKAKYIIQALKSPQHFISDSWYLSIPFSLMFYEISSFSEKTEPGVSPRP